MACPSCGDYLVVWFPRAGRWVLAGYEEGKNGIAYTPTNYCLECGHKLEPPRKSTLKILDGYMNVVAREDGMGEKHYYGGRIYPYESSAITENGKFPCLGKPVHVHTEWLEE